jgi:hypothetical protein
VARQLRGQDLATVRIHRQVKFTLSAASALAGPLRLPLAGPLNFQPRGVDQHVDRFGVV